MKYCYSAEELDEMSAEDLVRLRERQKKEKDEERKDHFFKN